MDCVFSAYSYWLRKVKGLETSPGHWRIYRWRKGLYHGFRYRDMTSGAAVPFIIRGLALADGFDEVYIQHRFFAKEHYRALAESPMQKIIVAQTDYGQEIHDQRAFVTDGIYLDILINHAYGGHGPRESGFVTMALKPRRTK